MRKWMYAAVTALCAAVYMIIEYKVRGYFAFGAEILFPALAIGIYGLNEERTRYHERNRNRQKG